MGELLPAPDSSTKPRGGRATAGSRSGILRRRRLAAGIAWVGLSVTLAAAQFTTGVNVVEVFATVTGPDGDAVLGLTAHEFEVLEDGELQTVTVFAAGDFALSVAIAIDRSWSMAGDRLALARSAAHTFLGELRADDQAMLIAIGSEIETLAPLSANRATLHAAVQRLEPWGTTALHDAVLQAIDRIQPARGRRALILLSDGIDRYSTATADDVLARARRSDVLVYPIAIGRARPPLFAELASLTGGRSFHVTDPRRLGATFSAIAIELRHQYLLGYSPERPLESEQESWRAIRVRVNRPGVRVRARDGYFVGPSR